MPKYQLIENGYVFSTVVADSAAGALDNAGEPDRSDYGDTSGTVWTTWYAVNVDDRNDQESREYQMDQDEPDCSDPAGHDWQSPIEIVGGIKENPGVWGNGGGVTIDECCMHCGCQRHTNTWAQNPENGQQGYTTVSYETGHYSEALASYLAEDE